MNRTKLITIRNELAAFKPLQRTELCVTYEEMIEILDAILDDSDHAKVWKDSPPKRPAAHARLEHKVREQQRENSP